MILLVNSNNRDGLFSSAAESEWAVPCPDIAWVSATRLSPGKTAAVTSRSGLHVLQHREGLKQNFSYLPFLTNQKHTYDNHLIQSFSKPFQKRIYKCFSFISCNFKKNVNNKCTYKYLQSINALLFTLAGKTGIKNLYCAKNYLVIPQS